MCMCFVRHRHLCNCVTALIIRWLSSYEKTRLPPSSIRDHAHEMSVEQTILKQRHFYVHILISKSRGDDHGRRRSDITQQHFQRSLNRLSILLLCVKHPNASYVFLVTPQAFDDLSEDNEFLEISRVRVSDTSAVSGSTEGQGPFRTALECPN